MLTLGVWNLMGSNFLFTPSGYGPDRVAIATLLGPLAPHAGWVFLCLGVIVGLIGFGLFALTAWARFIMLATLVIVSILTVVEIGSGFKHSYWGVVIVGLLKLALYGVVIWYFSPLLSKGFPEQNECRQAAAQRLVGRTQDRWKRQTSDEEDYATTGINSVCINANRPFELRPKISFSGGFTNDR